MVATVARPLMSLALSVTAPVLPATEVTGAEGRLVSCEPSTAGSLAEASSCTTLSAVVPTSSAAAVPSVGFPLRSE